MLIKSRGYQDFAAWAEDNNWLCVCTQQPYASFIKYMWMSPVGIAWIVEVSTKEKDKILDIKEVE